MKQTFSMYEFQAAYREAQIDVIKRLRGAVDEDDDPFAPIADDVMGRYAIWCLLHNLAIVMALYLTAQAMDRVYRHRAWYPSDGHPIPGQEP